jgi:hypothetical protein
MKYRTKRTLLPVSTLRRSSFSFSLRSLSLSFRSFCLRLLCRSLSRSLSLCLLLPSRSLSLSLLRDLDRRRLEYRRLSSSSDSAGVPDSAERERERAAHVCTAIRQRVNIAGWNGHTMLAPRDASGVRERLRLLLCDDARVGCERV